MLYWQPERWGKSLLSNLISGIHNPGLCMCYVFLGRFMVEEMMNNPEFGCNVGKVKKTFK